LEEFTLETPKWSILKSEIKFLFLLLFACFPFPSPAANLLQGELINPRQVNELSGLELFLIGPEKQDNLLALSFIDKL